MSPDQKPVTALIVPDKVRAIIQVPGELETLDDFQAIGCQIVAIQRNVLVALGAFAVAGRQHFNPASTKTEWAEFCRVLWGCARSTVFKAIDLAESPVEFPPDMFLSKAQKLLSVARGDEATLEILVDRATGEGWLNSDIDEMIHLKRLGLIGHPSTWHKPRFEIDGAQLVLHINGRQATIAWLEDADEDLVGAGRKLIEWRSRIE